LGPIDDDRALEGLRHAAQHGVNLFDTADVLGRGRSERLLGRLVDEVKRESCQSFDVPSPCGQL
jgi:aryl-alcohol dehydrogenase-like predicted oxidoreductase